MAGEDDQAERKKKDAISQLRFKINEDELRIGFGVVMVVWWWWWWWWCSNGGCVDPGQFLLACVCAWREWTSKRVSGVVGWLVNKCTECSVVYCTVEY